MQVAEVNIWEKLAGAVAWDENTGYATFEYESGFKQLGWELAPAYDVCHAYPPGSEWG